MRTIRQDIIELLHQETLNAIEVSQVVKIREKDVYGHLNHIERSLSTAGEKLETLPPRCMTCDFVFSQKGRHGRPGRCPQCKNSHIEAPRYRIVPS